MLSDIVNVECFNSLSAKRLAVCTKVVLLLKFVPLRNFLAVAKTSNYDQLRQGSDYV